MEWSLFDFALAQVGAVVTPIYPNSSPHDTAYILDHSESVGVLCGDAKQVASIEEQRGALPRLRYLLTVDDLAELEAEGARFKAENPTALADAIAAIHEDDLFTLQYTSGTTGPPKGCMVYHRNYYAMVAVIDHLPRYVNDEDLMLLYLPLAHNFGRLMHLTGAVRRLHDRLPAGSPADGGGAPDGAADRAAERPAGLREDPHRRRGSDGRDDRRQATAGRLVARRRARGRQGPGGRAAGRRCVAS